MDLGLFLLHLTVGLLFVGHGTQKLFGWWDGPGIQGTTRMMGSLELHPARYHALAAGLGETVGGALLALGLLTPVGAGLIIAVMTVATITVHLDKGLWNQDGGYEFPLVMATAAFALAAASPGAWSLDAALDLNIASAGAALVALAVGVLGGVSAVIGGRSPEMERRERPARPGQPAGQH
jgi:putative oxidoreductase